MIVTVLRYLGAVLAWVGLDTGVDPLMRFLVPALAECLAAVLQVDERGGTVGR